MLTRVVIRVGSLVTVLPIFDSSTKSQVCSSNVLIVYDVAVGSWRRADCAHPHAVVIQFSSTCTA